MVIHDVSVATLPVLAARKANVSTFATTVSMPVPYTATHDISLSSTQHATVIKHLDTLPHLSQTLTHVYASFCQ